MLSVGLLQRLQQRLMVGAITIWLSPQPLPYRIQGGDSTLH